MTRQLFKTIKTHMPKQLGQAGRPVNQSCLVKPTDSILLVLAGPLSILGQTGVN